MLQIKHSIIICTQGRSQEFTNLLHCLNEIATSVPMELVVVANSKYREENDKIEIILGNYKRFAETKYLLSTPGLPRSRNVGKRNLRGSYVTFLDDDTEVTSSFFDAIERLFESDANIVGIAPHIEVDPIIWGSGKQTFNTSLKNKRNAGKVSEFGKFTWIEFGNSYPIVDWLPGCAMSYRRNLLQQLDFNPALEYGVTGGYALGEDADFSMRMRKFGLLVGLSSESVLHKLSPISRASAEQMERARGAWLAYLTREFPTKFRNYKIIMGLVLNSVAIFFGIKSKSGLSRLNLEFALLRLSAFFIEKKNPKLISRSIK